jgi:hypothetical protein
MPDFRSNAHFYVLKISMRYGVLALRLKIPFVSYKKLGVDPRSNYMSG